MSQFSPERWKQVNEIFDEVADLDAATRQERLNELTAGDAELKGHVESLLPFDTDPSVPAIAQCGELRPLHQPSASVAGYRLLFPLAITYASEVWCAEGDSQRTPEAERVAIKFLRDDTDQRRLERFQNEAVLLAQLRHPNVAEFLDCGKTDDGAPYLVTRFISGKPLTEYADLHQLNVVQRVQLMMGVCDAVIYAHRFLVVHRDLKPGNILVTETGHSVVLDFGISKVVDGDGTLKTGVPAAALTLTTTAERPMTPAYASPEQVCAEPVTTATDVHALGLILYELACGHHPFCAAAHPTLPKLFDRISSGIPRLPSDMVSEPSLPLGVKPADGIQSGPKLIAALRSVTPAHLRRQLRGGVDSVALKAMAKSPDDRYRSVADLRSDLANLVSGQPVAARVDRDVVRASVRRFPLRWLVGVASLVGLLAIGATSLWWVRRLAESQRVTSETRAEAEQTRMNLEHSRSQLESSQSLLQQSLAWNEANGTNDVAVKVVNLGDSVSPEVAARLARRAADTGHAKVAAKLLEQIESSEETWSHPARAIPLAAAYQRLGRPTAGLRILGDLANSKTAVELLGQTDSSQMLGLKCVAMELLLDAGLTEAARDWSEADLGLDDWSKIEDGRHALLVAESRMRVGWDNGCDEILKAIQVDTAKFRMDTELMSRFALLRLALMVYKKSAWLDGNLIKLAKRGPADVQARVQLLQAEWDLEIGKNAKAARASLLAAVDTCEETFSSPHVVGLEAIRMLCEVAEFEGDDETRKKWLDRYWHLANSQHELGTITFAKMAVARMGDAEDAAEILQLMERLDGVRRNLRSYPYVERSVLIQEFESSFATNDLPRAEQAIRRLMEIEPKLWGDQSLEYAYVLAAKTDVEMRRNNKSQAVETLKVCQAALQSVCDKESDKATIAFLAPIIELGERQQAKLNFEWINSHKMHRVNTMVTQLEMLSFTAEQLLTTHPDEARAVMRSALGFLKGLSDISAEDEQNALRVCRVASRLGDYDLAKSLIKPYAKSQDPKLVDAAMSCVVYGLRKSQHPDDAYRIAEEWLGKLGETTDHLRAAVWQISQTLDEKESQRWNRLLE